MSWEKDNNELFDPNSSFLDFSVRDWGEPDTDTPSPTRARKQHSGHEDDKARLGGVVEEGESQTASLSETGSKWNPPPPPPPADGYTPSTGTGTSLSSSRPYGGSSLPDATKPFASPSSTYSGRKKSQPGHRSTPVKSNSYGSPEADHKRVVSPLRRNKSSRDGFSSRNDENHDTAETAPSSTLEDEDENEQFPSELEMRPSTPPNVLTTSDNLNEMSRSNRGESYSFEIDLPPPADVSPLSSKDSVVALMVQRAVEEAMAKNQMGGMVGGLPLLPPTSRHGPSPAAGGGRSKKSRLNDRDRMQRAARGVIEEQRRRSQQPLGPLHEDEEEGYIYSGALNDEEGEGKNYRRSQRRGSVGDGSQYSSTDSPSIHPEEIEQSSQGGRSRQRKSFGNSFSSGTVSSQSDSYNRGDDRDTRRGDDDSRRGGRRHARRESRPERDMYDDDRTRQSTNSDTSSTRRLRRGRKPGNDDRSQDDDRSRRGDDRSRRHRSKSRGPTSDRDDDDRRRRHRSRSRHYSPEGRDRDRGRETRSTRNLGSKSTRNLGSRSMRNLGSRSTRILDTRSTRNLSRGDRNHDDDEHDEQSSRRRGRRDEGSDYDYNEDDDRKSRRRRSRSPDDRYYDDDYRGSRDSSERDDDDYYRDDDRRRRRRSSPRGRRDGDDDDRKSRRGNRRSDDGHYDDDDDRKSRRGNRRSDDGHYGDDDDRKSRRGNRRSYDDYYDDDDDRRRRHRSRSRPAERDYDGVEGDDRRRRRRSRSRGRDRSFDRHEDKRRRHRSKSRGRDRDREYDDEEDGDRRRRRASRSRSRPRERNHDDTRAKPKGHGSHQDLDERSHYSVRSTRSSKSTEDHRNRRNNRSSRSVNSDGTNQDNLSTGQGKQRQDVKSPPSPMREVLKLVPNKALARSSQREKERDIMDTFHSSMSEVLSDFKANVPRQSDHSQTSGSGSNVDKGSHSKASKWDQLRAARDISKSGPGDAANGIEPRSKSQQAGTSRGSPSKWNALRKSADFIKTTKTRADRSRRRRSDRSPSKERKGREDGVSAENPIGQTTDELPHPDQIPISEQIVEERPPSPSKWAALPASNNFVRETQMRANKSKSKNRLDTEGAGQEDIHFSPTKEEDQPRSPLRFVEPKLTPLVMDGEKVTAAPQMPDVDKEAAGGETTTVANNSISTGALTDTAAVGMAKGSRWAGLNRVINDTMKSQEPVISEKTENTSDVEFVPDGFVETKPRAGNDGLVQVEPKIAPVVLGQGAKKDAGDNPPSKWGALRGSMDLMKGPVKQGSGRRLGLMQQDKPGSGRRAGLMQQDKSGSGRRAGLMQQDKPGSGRKFKVQDNGTLSKWKKLKHTFSFVNEAKRRAEDNGGSDEELEYGAVNSGNDFFEVTDADRKEYEKGIREQANQADFSTGLGSDPPQLDIVGEPETDTGSGEPLAVANEGKKSNWQNFGKLIRENRQKASEIRDRRGALQTDDNGEKGSRDVDGCVKVPPKITPVVLRSKGQAEGTPFADQPHLDENGFFGSSVDPTSSARNSNKQGDGKPSQQNMDDGLVHIQPRLTPVVLKTSGNEGPPVQANVPGKKVDDGLVQITPKLTPVVLKSQQNSDFFPSMEQSGGPQMSKWAGVKASNAFISSTLKKVKEQNQATDPFSTAGTGAASPDMSKWAGIKASNDFINSTKRKTRRRQQKEAEQNEPESRPGKNGSADAEINFVPESSQWDAVRKANELINEKKKRLADSRARQKELQSTSHSTHSQSVVSSDRGDSASDVTGDIKFNPSQSDQVLASIEELKASRLQQLKLAAATIQDMNSKDAAEAESRAERRHQRRSKWNGLRSGMEFVDKTKKLAEESKASGKSGSAPASGIASEGPNGANKFTSGDTKMDSKWSDLKAQMAVARETDGMAKAQMEGTQQGSRWAEIQAKLEADEQNTPEPTVSRWAGLRMQMASNAGEKGASGTTASKRSLWDGLKHESERKMNVGRTVSASSNEEEEEADRASRRAERKARRSSRWSAVKTGMDFIVRTKKLTEERKNAKQK